MNDAGKTAAAIAALRDNVELRLRSIDEAGGEPLAADSFDRTLIVALEALARRVAALEARPIPIFGLYA